MRIRIGRAVLGVLFGGLSAATAVMAVEVVWPSFLWDVFGMEGAAAGVYLLAGAVIAWIVLCGLYGFIMRVGNVDTSR